MPIVVNLALTIRKRAQNTAYTLLGRTHLPRTHRRRVRTLIRPVGHLKSTQKEWERLTQIMASDSSPLDFNDTCRSCGFTTTDRTGIRRAACQQCSVDLANETPSRAT